MVATRRRDYDWPVYNSQDYASQEECEACSQRSSQSSAPSNNDDGFDFDWDDVPGPSGPRYRANDRCKRHRLRDAEPYETRVTGYSRRKPRN